MSHSNRIASIAGYPPAITLFLSPSPGLLAAGTRCGRLLARRHERQRAPTAGPVADAAGPADP